MSKFMPSATPFQIDESVGGKWLIVSPETRPTPWGGLIPCHSHTDAEAKRDALNGVVLRVTGPRDAEIARLTAEVTTLRARCGRLANECFWARSLCDIKDFDRKHNEMIRARVQVDLHDDMSERNEQEPTDG